MPWTRAQVAALVDHTLLKPEATDVDVVTRVGRIADESDLAAWSGLQARGRQAAKRAG